jgi:hypothetical protein
LIERRRTAQMLSLEHRSLKEAGHGFNSQEILIMIIMGLTFISTLSGHGKRGLLLG